MSSPLPCYGPLTAYRRFGSTGADSSLGREAQSYGGHINYQTFLKTASFFGAEDESVCTGSDSGHLWIFDKTTGAVQALLEADDRACNGVVPHPHAPLLCSYGIDDTAKLWCPWTDDADTEEAQEEEAEAAEAAEADAADAAEAAGSDSSDVSQGSATRLFSYSRWAEDSSDDEVGVRVRGRRRAAVADPSSSAAREAGRKRLHATLKENLSAVVGGRWHNPERDTLPQPFEDRADDESEEMASGGRLFRQRVRRHRDIAPDGSDVFHAEIADILSEMQIVEDADPSLRSSEAAAHINWAACWALTLAMDGLISRGTELFKQKQFEKAAEKYDKARRLFSAVAVHTYIYTR